MRRILTFAIVSLITVFLLVLAVSQTTRAADAAVWNGDKIVYEGNSFTEKKADGTNPSGLRKDQIFYEAKSGTVDVFSGTSEAQVIYFDNDTNIDAKTTAKLSVYKLDNSGAYEAKIRGPTSIGLTPKALSASSTRAVWAGSNLVFDERTFTGPNTSTGSAPALPNGVQYFSAKGSLNAITGESTLYTISFSDGAELRTATKATYSEFRVDGSGNVGSRIGSGRSIDVVAATASNSVNNGNDPAAAAASSCTIEQIGWFVCPISNFLAWGMDNIFDMLKGFLVVQPLSNDTDGPLYQAWSMIRSIANIAFVIAFIIIIYSQLTSVGLNNYSLKKLLPRLIIAAVAVNVSYIICALALDISNILGSHLQDLLMGMREAIQMDDTDAVPTWGAVTSAILAATAGAGAVAIGTTGLIIASGASLGAAVILLLPMLLALIIAVLVALLVLAVRQALIILLIIIAPLAFVAYLLPNTEKWFEKWRGLFMTMLVFFPIFSLIFGGSQLAAHLIMVAADPGSDNFINIVLLAMFVQVAPLVLTPILIKFSGSLIGRIAGIVNNPSKGLIDRTRAWTKQQSDYMAARNMARQDPVRRRQVFRRFALGMDQTKRAREDRLSVYKETGDARWANSEAYSDIQQNLRYAQEDKAAGAEAAGLRYEASRTTDARVRNLDVRNRDLKLQVENAKLEADLQWDNNHAQNVLEQRTRQRVLKDSINAVHSTHDAEYEEFKYGRLGHLNASSLTSEMLRQSEQDTRLLAINAMRNESAKRAVTERFTKEMSDNARVLEGQSLQMYAGGVQGMDGAKRALAGALAAQSKALDDGIANANAILEYRNFSDAVVGQIALGKDSGTGMVISKEMRLAAIKRIAGGKNMTEILNLMRDIEINQSDENEDYRVVFADSLRTNGSKPKAASAGWLGNVQQGIAAPSGKARMDHINAEAMNGNKLSSADALVSLDKDDLGSILATIQNNLSTTSISPIAKANMLQAIQMARKTPQYAGRIAERKEVIDKIENALRY